MVGKPNFPPDVETRKDLKGAAAPTPGLNALDQEREASLADEGGATGMAAETQDPDGAPEAKAEEEDDPSELGGEVALLGAGLLSAFLFVFYLNRR